MKNAAQSAVRRVICILLTTLMLSTSALAGSYKTYSDGSIDKYEVKDKYDVVKVYYDIYHGAVERPDTSDPSRFLRDALKAGNKYSPVLLSMNAAWHDISKGVAYSAPYARTNQKHSALIKDLDKLCGGYIVEGGNDLIEANGLKGAEAGIRKTMSANLNARTKSKFKPEDMPSIKELADSPFSGNTFFTQNTLIFQQGSPFPPMAIAYGVIFYDFKLSFLNTPDILYSAIGSETDISKLEGRPGFSHTTSPGGKTFAHVLTNESLEPAKLTQKLSKGNTLTTSNSVSKTDSYSYSEMIGLDVSLGFKLPHLNKAVFKTSLTTSQTIGSTEARSISKTEELSAASGVEVMLPAYTQLIVDQINTLESISIEYDYPLAVSFKTKVYVSDLVMGSKTGSIAATFGLDSQAGHESASDNIGKRFNNRAKKGYEDTYGDGLDWNSVDEFVNRLASTVMAVSDFAPMSVTGGTISYTADTIDSMVHKAVPLYPLTNVVVMGENYYQLRPNQTLNVGGLGLEGFSDSARLMPYSDFSKENGHWRMIDENLRTIENSDIASLTVNPVTGRTVLTAGSALGTVYLEYLIDEDKYTYVDNKGGFTRNSDLESTALIEIEVRAIISDYGETVEAEGSLTGIVGGTIDLDNARDLKVIVKNGQGDVIKVPPYSITWTTYGNASGISIEANQLDLNVPGEYSIVANYQSAQSGPISVTVLDGAIPVTGLTLDASKRTMAVGDSVRLKATITPENATDKGVTWISEDASIASVDNTGLVTALSEGKTEIMAVTNDNDCRATCQITVKSPSAIGKIKMPMEKLAIAKGSSYKLAQPLGFAGTWSTADENVAIINAKGAVKAKAIGETKLIFTVGVAKDGATLFGKSLLVGDTASIPLVVRPKGSVVKNVKLSPAKMVIGVDKQLQLEATLKPAKAIDLETYYTSSDETIATVDSQGLVRGVSKGKATITATSASGKSAQVAVTVADGLQKIKLNKSKKTLKAGNTFALVATLTPANEDKTLKWSSSKETVATVDGAGLVTAVKKGKATITVEADGVSAKCVITVK